MYAAEKGSRLFAYKRGGMLLAVNPSLESLTLTIDREYRPVFQVGQPTLEGKTLCLPPQTFAVLS